MSNKNLFYLFGRGGGGPEGGLLGKAGGGPRAVGGNGGGAFLFGGGGSSLFGVDAADAVGVLPILFSPLSEAVVEPCLGGNVGLVDEDGGIEGGFMLPVVVFPPSLGLGLSSFKLIKL